MIDDILSNAEAKMAKAIKALKRELTGLRTGRASPGLVEYIRANYYGAPTPINQLAAISVPEAQMLIIQPWDKVALPAIEKAILKSELGLNPSSDGNVIRLMIPPLTEERRKGLIKIVKKRVEEGRINIRNIRREAIGRLREMERKKEISKDEEERAMSQLQLLTNSFIENVDRIGEDKEMEVLES